MTTYQKEITSLLSACDAFAEEDEGMPLSRMRLFLAVAAKPGISMPQLMKDLNMAQSTVSRNVLYLGEWFRPGEPGLDWITTVDDPEVRNRKLAFLTTKGRKRAEKMLSKMMAREITLSTVTVNEYLKAVYRGE